MAGISIRRGGQHTDAARNQGRRQPRSRIPHANKGGQNLPRKSKRSY